MHIISALGTYNNACPRMERFIFELVSEPTYQNDITGVINYYDFYYPTFITFFGVKEEVKNLHIQKNNSFHLDL